MKPVLAVVASVVVLSGELSTVYGQLSDLFPGMRNNREVRILAEIDQLANAVNAVRASHQAPTFPPCLGEADPVERKVRFMKYVASAWPGSKYGETAGDYDRLKQKIATEWKYDYLDRDGAVQALDLDRLDPAESVVFWLNGFPTPLDPATKKPIAELKEFPFHRDPTDPLKRDPAAPASDAPLRDRAHRRFDFIQARLVDKDHDGWWEYQPALPSEDADRAPYVYFDAATYAETMKSVERMGSCLYPRDPALAKLWGTATPYLETFDGGKPEAGVWAKKEQFQIITGGLDGKYAAPGDGTKLPAPRLTVLRPFKSFLAADKFAEPKDVDPVERDNLTNLGFQSIGELK
jgi:hypothetical protein